MRLKHRCKSILEDENVAGSGLVRSDNTFLAWFPNPRCLNQCSELYS